MRHTVIGNSRRRSGLGRRSDERSVRHGDFRDHGGRGIHARRDVSQDIDWRWLTRGDVVRRTQSRGDNDRASQHDGHERDLKLPRQLAEPLGPTDPAAPGLGPVPELSLQLGHARRGRRRRLGLTNAQVGNSQQHALGPRAREGGRHDVSFGDPSWFSKQWVAGPGPCQANSVASPSDGGRARTGACQAPISVPVVPSLSFCRVGTVGETRQHAVGGGAASCIAIYNGWHDRTGLSNLV